MRTRIHMLMIGSLATGLVSAPAAAQCCGDSSPAAIVRASARSQPEKDKQPEKGAKAERAGDPYPLDTCPISGKKLGSMGDPVVKVYDGREIRFCCSMCPPRFEKDLAASLAKVDEKVTKDQGPLYPLKTSLVTGKDLPAKPYEFVYGNRLVRLGGEEEKAGFLKDPKRSLGELDKAVVAAQGADYPLKTCPVSKDELGGDMGKPVDMVVGGRLIRLCCKDCKEEVEKNPAKFIAMVDAARKAASRGGRDEEHTARGHK